MSISVDSLRASIVQYCAEIGKDRLLVQGAGGNVSWKDGGTLWVKASGTWLSDAAERDIFVPVDLNHLSQAIKSDDFSMEPKLTEKSDLKPSIETLLHALMPQRVVVHLHAIEALAHLVRDTCHDDFLSLLGDTISWVMVDYFKPGAEMAEAVSKALAKQPNVNVIFLKNHGVVIGGDDVLQVHKTLSTITDCLATRPTGNSYLHKAIEPTPINEYIQVTCEELQCLALNVDLFGRLQSDWALYPDHVVFLGPHANTYSTWEALEEKRRSNKDLPELVFVQDVGVFSKTTFNEAKLAQLRCYCDVILRQEQNAKLNHLKGDQIAELLNWDAERYRMSLAK